VADVANRHVEIGDIWIDVSVREGHALTADVTEHPVEAGADVADHIRPMPATIDIDGAVTNHPIELPKSHAGTTRVNPSPIEIKGEPTLGAIGLVPGAEQAAAVLGALKLDVRSKRVFSASVLHFTEPFDRVSAVHAALVSIFERRALVTVVTGLMTYQNVALTALHIERTSEAGQGRLNFSASGKVLRIVNSQTAKLPDPVDARAKPRKSRGKQPTQPVSPPPASLVAPGDTDKQSLLSKIPSITKDDIKKLIGL